MKITRRKLRQLLHESIQTLNEAPEGEALDETATAAVLKDLLEELANIGGTIYKKEEINKLSREIASTMFSKKVPSAINGFRLFKV